YVKNNILFDSLGEVVSHTTRDIREKDGEVNGVTYYYVSKEDFKKMEDNNEFAERIEYDGNFYGVSKREIDGLLKGQENVYIIVEYEGYKQIKKIYPDAIGIFMYMSKEECMANMLLRGDSLDKAMKRISTYEKEMMSRYQYDYVVKNVRDKQYNTAVIISNIINQYKNNKK